MIHLTYLAALSLGIVCMLLIDYRLRLAFFAAPRRAAVTLLSGLLLFTIWDLFGIHLGIFFTGDSPYTSGILLATEFPLEELFFLFFLCYFTLITYRSVEEIWRQPT